MDESTVTQVTSVTTSEAGLRIIDKSVDKGFDILTIIHTEAGLVAMLLAVWCVYLMISLWWERRVNRQLTNKLYTLGINITASMTKVGDTLDKVYTIVFTDSNKE